GVKCEIGLHRPHETTRLPGWALRDLAESWGRGLREPLANRPAAGSVLSGDAGFHHRTSGPIGSAFLRVRVDDVRSLRDGQVLVRDVLGVVVAAAVEAGIGVARPDPP